jgi:hypothetical protein
LGVNSLTVESQHNGVGFVQKAFFRDVFRKQFPICDRECGYFIGYCPRVRRKLLQRCVSFDKNRDADGKRKQEEKQKGGSFFYSAGKQQFFRFHKTVFDQTDDWDCHHRFLLNTYPVYLKWIDLAIINCYGFEALFLIKSAIDDTVKSVRNH